MKSKLSLGLWALSLFAILLLPNQLIAQQDINVTQVSISNTIQTGEVLPVNITIENTGDAVLNWSATLSDTYGRGEGVSFTKADFASWLLPANQDRISDNIWIARGDNKSIFNAKSETTSDNNSPSDTEWALGLLNDASGYDTFKNMHGGDPQSLIGETATLHTITDNDFYELDFTSWTGGNSGGGFAYTRHRMHEYVSFTSVASGALSPGSTILSLNVSAADIIDGMYSSSLTITSDDPDEGTIIIPIEIEVLESATFELSATSFSQTVTTGDEPAVQTLTISNNGASELQWESDGTRDRPEEMSGVTLNTNSGSVAAGESAEVDITFSDDGNYEGSYEWLLDLSSNDRDNEESTISISLNIIGEALIDHEAPSYATTFVGTTTSGTLILYNEGTADLEISGITSSISQFTSTAGALTIPPGDSEEVSVLFSPDAAGTFNTDITVNSNDSETPALVIALTGDAILAPTMEVTPLSVTSSIAAGGTDSHSITVSNTGDSDLEWNFLPSSSPKTRDESTSTTFTKTNNADISMEANQDRISDNVWITRGSSEPLFNYVEETYYMSNSSTIEWASGATEDANPEDYSNFEDAVNSNASSLPGKTLSLHLIEEDRYFDLEFSSWTCCGGGGGFSYTRTEVVGWLETSVSSPQDPIAAGEDFSFDLVVNGELLIAGDYEGKLVINSNDPLQNEIEVEVNISVSGTPDITSTETTGGTDTEIGNTKSFNVPIINDGTDDLTISNVSIDNDVFVPSETSIVLPAQSSYDLIVDFSPTAEQTFTGDLTITSDDPVSPSYVVALSGDGLPAPTLVVSDMVLSATIESGTSTSTSFTITNDGLGSLNWEIGGVAFEKGDYVDYTLAENQDRIKEDVWITRKDYGSLFNQNDGGSSDDVLFYDSETYGSSLDDYVTDMTNIGGLSGTPGSTWSLYLSEYDEYYDLLFGDWTNGGDSGNGGGGGFSYTRRPAVNWLSLDNFGETIDEAPSVVNVTFNAADLAAGNYEFSHTINTNDPANLTKTITFQLEVTGSPNLSVDEGSQLSFGDQFVDTDGSGSLIIRNTGSATLNVSDIQFDDAAFSVSATTASIDPNESVTLDLTFSPTAEQTYNATGTITSDDAESPATFSVSGTGVPAPDVSLDVSSIDIELLSGGSVEKSFTVTNNSTNSANWSIDKIIVTGTEEVLFEKADFADWTLAENQDRITDNVWITRADQQGLFNAAIETEYTSGDRRRLLAIDADIIAIPVEGADPYDASPKGTLWASNPTFDLVEESYRSWRSATPDGAESLPGNTLSMWLAEENRYFDVEFLTWTSGEGCCSNPLMGGGFSYLRYETVNWLNSFSSTDGALDAESDEMVSFNIDADGISAGDYAATIVVSDGLNTHDIAVTLTVLGLPEISVDETSVDFESVFIGNELTKEVEISNTGLADLEISSVSSNNTAFVITSAPTTIGIDQSGIVEVTFVPTESVSYSGTLTINSNDAANSSLNVSLSGLGQNPPILNVDKTSLDQTLFFGASASQTFTISNSGSADLEWNLGVSGGSVEFTRPDNVDWTLAQNQDRIKDDVWITRGSSGGIFNIAQEDEFDKPTSPIGTLWSYGATLGGDEEGGGEVICCIEKIAIVAEGEGSYSNWRDEVGGQPSPNNTYSMYLTEHDLYYDVVFNSWASGNDDGQGSTGGFTYTRTPVFYEYEAVSFSNTEGVVAPGESMVVTVFFNPEGTFDGQFELDLQVESNDPSGPAEIPLSLNVNGIIVEIPIDDQLENEGFGTSAFDVSAMFADAQDDPLTYSVTSSDGAVASAIESGGTLTVTEVGIGTTTIAITAEDGKGSSDTYEFEFRVNAIPIVSTPIPDQSYENAFGSDVIDLSAVFSDGDASDVLQYSASESTAGVVSTAISNGMLTITEVGPGTVNVTITANDGFGGEVQDVFEVFVNKINQTITFGALETVGDDVGSIQLTATASSNLAVTYESSNTSVATVSGSTLNILSHGQTTITASQAGDAAYNAATPVSQQLTVEEVLSASVLESIEVYPNPVEDYLSISNASASKIEIYHLDGKLVLSQEVSERADLSKLKQGMYLIKVMDRNEEEIYSGRLVKN